MADSNTCQCKGTNKLDALTAVTPCPFNMYFNSIESANFPIPAFVG